MKSNKLAWVFDAFIKPKDETSDPVFKLGYVTAKYKVMNAIHEMSDLTEEQKRNLLSKVKEI